MPRAKKTRSGDRAQQIKSVAGQRYGEGVAQQEMQRAMPAPNRAASSTPNVPARRMSERPAPRQPQSLDQVAQLMQALPKGTMRQPTGNERPVTHGLPSGPGAGPEVLSPYTTRVPGLRAVEMLARVSDNPLYKDILARFNR
jgi:hypothetical protein